LEADQAKRLAAASPIVAAAIEAAAESQKPARRAFTPRRTLAQSAAARCDEAVRTSPRGSITCPADSRSSAISARSCHAACDTVIAAPEPDHAIARGRAGAALLAHIAVSKYDDHLPLYRQAEIFARDGVELKTSTLSGWVGATAAALQPLIDALAAEIMTSDTLHVDDTPVPVPAPGAGT